MRCHKTLSELLREFDQNILNEYDDKHLKKLNEKYKKYAMVPLRDFIPVKLLNALQKEAMELIQKCGTKHNMKFAITDDTPRAMTTVGQPVIEAESQIIPALYSSEALLAMVGAVVGERIYHCPYLGERYVVSHLREGGDTHGWHWDDYTIAIVWILEAPQVSSGGFVQCVPNTHWDKRSPDVLNAFIDNKIYSYAFKAGDAYILKANTTMHRVYPLRHAAKRLIINTTWATAADLKKTMTHETNNSLFGGATNYAKKSD